MKDNISILIKNFRYKSFFENIVSKLEKIEKLNSNQVSVIIAGDEFIRNLNKKYRHQDKTTDVLSFAEIDIQNNFFYKEIGYLGEIIINIEQVKRQAIDVKQELVLMLVHGYLHLIGYDHNSNKDDIIMDKKSKKLITMII